MASITRPVRELKGFARVALEPGEQRTVTFTVPTDLLSFVGVDLVRIVEPGIVELKIGASSADIRLETSIELVGDTRTCGEDRALFTGVSVR